MIVKKGREKTIMKKKRGKNNNEKKEREKTIMKKKRGKKQ